MTWEDVAKEFWMIDDTFQYGVPSYDPTKRMAEEIVRLRERVAGLILHGTLKVEDSDALQAERAYSEKLREALADVFALLDEGWLCRDISQDHKNDFALRQIPFVARLKQAKDTLDMTQPGEVKANNDIPFKCDCGETILVRWDSEMFVCRECGEVWNKPKAKYEPEGDD